VTFREILEKLDGGLAIGAEALDAIKVVTGSREVGEAEAIVDGVRSVLGIVEGAGTAQSGIAQIQAAIQRFKTREATDDEMIDQEIEELPE
jgi:hypothetical protein